MRVDVSPSLGKQNWTFRVERLSHRGWTSMGTYRTGGHREVRKINLDRGTYRVVVLESHPASVELPQVRSG